MKVFIDVLVLFTSEGKIIPKAIYWDDGRRFNIDKVIDVRRAASVKTGGTGVRFRCTILGRERDLFLDDNRWFIEK